MLDGSVVGSLDGVRGLDTGTILAFSDINRAGGVVVVVVYLNTSLCKVGSRRSDMDGSMLEKSSSEVKKKVEEEKENRSFEIASPFQNKSRPGQHRAWLLRCERHELNLAVGVELANWCLTASTPCLIGTTPGATGQLQNERMGQLQCAK